MSLVGRVMTIARGSVTWADGQDNASVDLTDMTDPTEEPVIALSVGGNQSVNVYDVTHSGVHWTLRLLDQLTLGLLQDTGR